MIPDFQTIMLPLLRTLEDQKEHKFRDLIEQLADTFQLSEEERKELLPSGLQAMFDNRVAWARTYLKKAGLIDTPKRGNAVITDRGIDVLKENPTVINIKYLSRFTEFIDFKNMRKNSVEHEEPADKQPSLTPQEQLDSAYIGLRQSLADELLQRIIKQSPTFFEQLVVELLVKMGYGGSIKEAGKAIGKTNDEGIDGTIKEDRLGLDIIYIQAKRWKPGNVVGRPELQKFVGALAGQGAKKGIFITTSSFTKDAIDYSPKNETKIVLIDGEQLAQLMIDYGIGVSSVKTYEIKRIDNDYFGDE